MIDTTTALADILDDITTAVVLDVSLIEQIAERLYTQGLLRLCASPVTNSSQCGAYRRHDHAFCPSCERTITELYDQIRRADLHRQGLEDWPDHPEV